MSNAEGKKKIQHIEGLEYVDFVAKDIELSHIDPHNLAEFLERIGRVEAEIEKDKNEIKRISEKIDLHIAVLNEKASSNQNLIIGVLVAFLIFSCSLWYAHFEVIPKLENQISLQAEQIQNLEDDTKELQDIVKKYFIK